MFFNFLDILYFVLYQFFSIYFIRAEFKFFFLFLFPTKMFFLCFLVKFIKVSIYVRLITNPLFLYLFHTALLRLYTRFISHLNGSTTIFMCVYLTELKLKQKIFQS